LVLFPSRDGILHLKWLFRPIINAGGLSLELDHLLSFPLVYRWQIILDDLILPIVHGPLPLLLLLCVILILYVHPSVVRVISHFELVYFFREKVRFVVLVLRLF
jgi:hypothetical protein